MRETATAALVLRTRCTDRMRFGKLMAMLGYERLKRLHIAFPKIPYAIKID